MEGGLDSSPWAIFFTPSLAQCHPLQTQPDMMHTVLFMILNTKGSSSIPTKEGKTQSLGRVVVREPRKSG